VKKEETRRRLLDAGAYVFAQRGFAAATLDEIAAAAGLTKGAVYSNFDSKADLAVAVLERRFHQLIELFAQIDATLSLEDQFRQIGQLLVRELDTAVPWFQLELECTVAATRSPELLRRLRSRGETMRATVAGALQEHFGDREDALPTREMASALIALVNGVALERLKDPASMPEDLVTRVIAAVKLSFLAPVS
jgi:AcrR family transcriptional regulator